MKRIDYFIGSIAVAALFLLLVEISPGFSSLRQIIKVTNAVILIIFISEVILRFLFSTNKRQYLRDNWLDSIVFLPLLQFVFVDKASHLFVIIWQIVIITVIISRVRKINRLLTLVSLRPVHLMIVSFLLAILVGTILLMLPISSVQRIKTPFLDALFTATSATCVTGLIVKDTATYYSLFGQMVILGLIQIGGLGIMTFSTSLVLLLRKPFQMKQQLEMKEILDQETITSVKNIILFIIKMTFLLELLGALCLYFYWRKMFSWQDALWYGVFHSVSAFCNAGFSTFSDSLIRFSRHTPTNIIISFLIISGGIGFVVIQDIAHSVKGWVLRKTKLAIRMRVQTKVTLALTLFLVLAGGILIYFTEQGRAFLPCTRHEKIIISLFHSITTRTAGFNTWDIAVLSPPTLLAMTVLMFIGGAPGSTAGGIKTTTVSVLWATIKSGFLQKQYVELHRRTIPEEVIRKAIIVVLISLATVVIFSFLLLFFEKMPVMDVLFETVSAFGTVGLSTGITSRLSWIGKVLITVLMFIGRMGPLTVGYAFIRSVKSSPHKYAEERIMIG